MPIFRIGNFDDFSATFADIEPPMVAKFVSENAEQPNVPKKQSPTEMFRQISAVMEANKNIKQNPIFFEKSVGKRGIALKSLKLLKGFEGFIENAYNASNELYLLSWGWDFSGEPPYYYPEVQEHYDKSIIQMAAGDTREFLGSGLVLFPSRQITAGIALRIMIWESDQGVRNFGYTMKKVSNAIQESNLNKILSSIGTIPQPTINLINTIKNASFELADIIGDLLEKNADDYVDLFEGYYPASVDWTEGEESYTGYASEITLNRMK